MPPNVQLISVYFRNLVNAFTSDSKACWNTKLNFLVCLFVFPAFVVLLCGPFLDVWGLHHMICLKKCFSFQNTAEFNALGTTPDFCGVPAKHLLKL